MNRRFFLIYIAASSLICTLIVGFVVYRLPWQGQKLIRPLGAVSFVFLLATIATLVAINRWRPHWLGVAGIFLCSAEAALISMTLGLNFVVGDPSVYVPAVGFLVMVNALIFFFSTSESKAASEETS